MSPWQVSEFLKRGLLSFGYLSCVYVCVCVHTIMFQQGGLFPFVSVCVGCLSSPLSVRLSVVMFLRGPRPLSPVLCACTGMWQSHWQGVSHNSSF